MDPYFMKFFVIISAIMMTFFCAFKIKDKRIRTVVILFILLIISLVSNRSIYWLVYWDGPYHGRIIDKETDNPIEGVAVAGIWNFEYFHINSGLGFADAKETTTGKSGEFRLPLTFVFSLYPAAVLQEMDLLVYKPGYDSHPPAIQRRMKPEWADYTPRDGMYWVGRRVYCKAKVECLVELNETRSIEEEKVVYRRMGFGHIPASKRYKLRDFLTLVNQERRKFGADDIFIEWK